MRNALFLVFIAFAANCPAQFSIVPQPDSIVYSKGSFTLAKGTRVCFEDSTLEQDAQYLSERLSKDYQLSASLCQSEGCKKNFIKLVRSQNENSDSYRLTIDKNEITIEGGANGIFYGIQSLLQIINAGKNNTIPCGIIADSPKFGWRGMHLDVCRHFFSADEVKKYLDYLAMYKMNVFHWHLTEDQGWRIEIKKYPKLTETGAWRNGSMVGSYSDQKFDSTRYGGFYTQQEIKEIVQYAKERHITIVPEIEMPGHALAALASYPELSCTGGPFEVGKSWGVFDDVYCAGNNLTIVFIENVLDEVISLFPGEYIHIGGDECPKTRWKNCTRCQSRMATNGLKDEHELQSYFIQRIEKYLNNKGKKIIGWDEILEGGLAPNAAVMSWRGTDGGIAAARQQHPVVMTPGKPCYFDHYQHADKNHEPLAIGGLNTLKDVYTYSPIPESLNESEKKYILGAQGNVWTEYVPNFKQVEYMALPRMAAMAEVLWSVGNQKNYDDFIKRLKIQSGQLDKMNANYSRHFLSE